MGAFLSERQLVLRPPTLVHLAPKGNMLSPESLYSMLEPYRLLWRPDPEAGRTALYLKKDTFADGLGLLQRLHRLNNRGRTKILELEDVG